MEAAEGLKHREVGTVLLGRGLIVAAREAFVRWLDLVEGSGDPALVIPALNGLTKVACSAGDLEAAQGYLSRAVPFLEQPGTPWQERLRVYLNLVMVYTDVGRLDEALAYSLKAEELEPDRDPQISVPYWLNRSVLAWRRQEWVPMRVASDRAYDRSKVAGNVSGLAMSLTNRGIAHLELGAHRLAERDLTNALKLAAELGPSELAYTYAELGRLHFQRGDHHLALENGREALRAILTHVAVLDKEEVARISRLFGAIFSTSNQRNLALKYLNRAAAYYSQLGLRGEWQRSTEAIGQMLSAPVRPTRSPLTAEVHQLDFLTSVLDLTDDLESVDPYLRGHSERVASLAVLLGEEIGLPEEMLVTLNFAARLHDVGMIACEADLLHRPGPLTEAEKRRISLHTTIGEEMIRPYGLAEAGLQAIRHHHEHFDGLGEPDGLAGTEIPILARIIAVVDVYDALTSERVYRSAMSHSRAAEELRAMAGRELDPELVERFLSLHEV